MNRTIWKYIGIFFIAAAVFYPAALMLSFLPLDNNSFFVPVTADAWAETLVSSETPSVQQESAQLPPQDQGASPISAPSTTPPEERKIPAAGSDRQDGEQLPVQPPQGQGIPQADQPRKQESQKAGEQKVPAPPAIGEDRGTDSTIVDVVHGGISHGILSTATWLDSFFGDKRYASELNTSYVRFGYNVLLEHDAGPLLKPDLQLRVVLPQLREKTHLVISGVPKEENEFSAIQAKTTTETDQFATTGDRNITAALHYAPLETLEQNFTIRAGLKLHRAGPVALLGPRYRVLIPFANVWSFRFVEDVAWRSDNGWLYRTTADLERPLPRNLFFRTSTEWVHTEHAAGYIYSYSCAIRQPLSERRAVEYEWLNIFQTRPVNELEEVDLRVHFRRRVWRKWLYFEVMPQLRFPRDRAFESTPGILFRLEMFLGSYT